MELKVGIIMSVETIVDETNVAAKYSKDLPSVFSTPDMISEMEAACYRGLIPYLEEGKASVGTHVNVSHDMAVPMGQKIKTTATLVEIDKRKLVFEVEATTEDGKRVGKGTHTRFVVDKKW